MDGPLLPTRPMPLIDTTWPCSYSSTERNRELSTEHSKQGNHRGLTYLLRTYNRRPPSPEESLEHDLLLREFAPHGPSYAGSLEQPYSWPYFGPDADGRGIQRLQASATNLVLPLHPICTGMVRLFFPSNEELSLACLYCSVADIALLNMMARTTA